MTLNSLSDKVWFVNLNKACMRLINFFTFLFLVFSCFSEALEKDRYIAFSKMYENSQIQCGGKVAYAIENNFPDVAEFLLLNGESVNVYMEKYPLTFNAHEYKLSENLQNAYIKHPLITAIRKGYNKVALVMIDLGIGNTAEEYKVEYKKQFGIAREEVERKNAMYVAIEECVDCHDIVLSLLVNGFDVNTNTNLNVLNKPYAKPGFEHQYQFNCIYTTPLVQAIALKKIEIVELLLKQGAEIDKSSDSPYAYDNNGYQHRFRGTPLLKAVDDHYIEGITLLLGYGADPLKGSLSPLDRAIQKNYTIIVDLLFSAISN